jgi:hypothetical protein
VICSTPEALVVNPKNASEASGDLGEFVTRTPKRIQKANGARRNMWGEDENDVRLF